MQVVLTNDFFPGGSVWFINVDSTFLLGNWSPAGVEGIPLRG